MSLFNILQHSSQALMASGKSIQVTTNNVANANTPGYARQSLTLATRGTERSGGLLLGMGVSAQEVSSAYDGFSQGQVYGRLGEHAHAGSKQAAFESIESMFVDGDASGIGSSLHDFFDSFEELEANPSLSGARLRVLQAGENLASFFNRTARDLDARQVHADNRVVASLTGVNNLTTQIAELNRTIKEFEAGGKQAHDLRSQRTDLVEQLSEFGPVRTEDGSDGTLRVLFGGHTIVEGGKARPLSAVQDPVTGFSEVHIGMANTSFRITESLEGSGKIAAAIYERDTVLQGMENNLDELAFTVHQEVNNLHVTGFGLDGVTARNFFSTQATVAGAAAALSIDALVDGNPDAVAASTTLAGIPGDNSNARALADLAEGLTMTFTDFYAGVISELGHDSRLSQQETMRLEVQLEAVRSVRDQASAVSLEEEALDLVRFQDSYQAAARVMNVAKEMLDELLNII